MKQKPLQLLLSRVIVVRPRLLWQTFFVENAAPNAIPKWCTWRWERSLSRSGGDFCAADVGPELCQAGGESRLSTSVVPLRCFALGDASLWRRKKVSMIPCPGLGSWRGFAAPVGGSSKTGRSAGGGEPGGKADRRINRAIVARMVRLVGEDGHEILSRFDALNRAQQEGLDLVEVDGKADPPVCKLMDFSKERFKDKMKEKELRKKHLERRRLDDLKEVRFSSRTEQKDLELKADIVSRLLLRGHRVKLVVQFHGNDKGEDVGVQFLERAMAMLQADMKVENGPRVEKMRAWVMIRPVVQEQKSSKKKSLKAFDERLDVVKDERDSQAVKTVEG